MAFNSECFFLQKKQGQNSFKTEVKTGVCFAPVLFVFCLCFVNSECPYCLNPPRHAFYQILTHLCWYLVPLHLNPLPQCLNAIWRLLIPPQPGFDIMP